MADWGREHALALARRGAKVVVNGLGGSVDGRGASDAAARVVAEIEAMGGEAMAEDILAHLAELGDMAGAIIPKSGFDLPAHQLSKGR